MVTFHDADTNTDTDTDILADFRARIVHEPDTHEDPRRLVRHAARFSSRGCPLGMRACTRVYTVHDKLSCTRLQNYTNRHIPNVGVRVRVGVGPMEFQLTQLMLNTF